jgi:hypothetical protein
MDERKWKPEEGEEMLPLYDLSRMNVMLRVHPFQTTT